MKIQIYSIMYRNLKNVFTFLHGTKNGKECIIGECHGSLWNTIKLILKVWRTKT